MEWYYADERKQQIAVEESELRKLVEEEKIKPDTLVWNETMTDWRAAADVLPDLFDHELAPPALTPAQRYPAGSPMAALPRTSAPTSGNAICSLVFGILGIVTCFPIFAIVAIICGHIGRRSAKLETLPSANGGLSLAGLITGYIGFLAFLVFILFYGAIFIAAISSGDFDT